MTFRAAPGVWKYLGLLGLDPDKLPSLGLASELLGAVTKEAAQITGLRAGTPVAVGAGDFPMALLGSGVTRSGSDATSPAHRHSSRCWQNEPALDPKIFNLLCVLGGWAAFTIVDAGGDAMRWARTVLHHQALQLRRNRLAGRKRAGRV